MQACAFSHRNPANSELTEGKEEESYRVGAVDESDFGNLLLVGPNLISGGHWLQELQHRLMAQNQKGVKAKAN